MPKKSGTKKGEEKQREGKEKHKEGKEKQKDKISDEDEEVEGGIEDSIRRCEALLACSPLSIMPGSSCDSKPPHLRPKRYLERLRMERSKPTRTNIEVRDGASTKAPDESEWKKNMGLLSQSGSKWLAPCPMEEATCPRSATRLLTVKTIPVQPENISVTQSHYLSFRCGDSPEHKEPTIKLGAFPCFTGSPKARQPKGEFDTSSNSSSRMGAITWQKFPMLGEITSQSTTLDIINMASKVAKKGTRGKRVACAPLCGAPGDDSSSSDDWTFDSSSRVGISSPSSGDNDKKVDVTWTEKSDLKAVKDGVAFHVSKECRIEPDVTTCMSFSTVIGGTAAAWKSCVTCDSTCCGDGDDGGHDDGGGGDDNDKNVGKPRWRPIEELDERERQPGVNLKTLKCTCKVHIAGSKRLFAGGRRSKSVPKEWVMGPLYKKYPTVVIREKLTGEDRIKYLATPRTDLYKKCAQLKAEMDNEEFLNECSFKPKLVKRYRGATGDSKPMLERLAEMQKRLEERKRARRVNEREELDMISFWPQTNTEYDHIPYQPIQERAEEWQQRRTEKLLDSQKKIDLEAGCTYKPEINKRSVRLIKQRGDQHTTFEERLTSNARSSVHEGCKSHQGECYTDGKYQCTFVPIINKNTDPIIWKSREFSSCSGFFSRQKRFVERLNKFKKPKEKEKLPSAATFVPKISDCDSILRKSANYPDILQEGPAERWERLSVRDKVHHDQHMKTIIDAANSKFSYQPQLDKVSRLLGRESSIQMLHTNEKAMGKKARLMLAANAAFKEKCSFHPQINATSKTVIKDKKTMELVRLRRLCHREEKARRQRLAKVLKELQEVRECTFQPMTHSAPPRTTNFVVIKGLERHLELQNIAKNMKKDQQELEKKIFLTHAYAFPPRQYTIPKPFRFHTQGKDVKYCTSPPPKAFPSASTVCTTSGCILGCKQDSFDIDPLQATSFEELERYCGLDYPDSVQGDTTKNKEDQGSERQVSTECCDDLSAPCFRP